MNDAALAGPGHNLAPADIDILRERLEDETAPLLDRKEKLLASCARAPKVISDEDTAGKVADLIKLITACVKNAEATRVARKEPYLAQGRLVDSTFKLITDPLDAAKKGVERTLTMWQRQVAEDERRAREAEARRQQEEADRLRKEALHRAAVLDDEADLDAAVSAEELARQAGADADKAQRAATAKPADMSRVRGGYGAVGSLHTYWDFADLDRAKLNLEVLRHHLPQDALEKAVRAFIKAGGREIAGARIFENSTSHVR